MHRLVNSSTDIYTNDRYNENVNERKTGRNTGGGGATAPSWV